MSMKLNRKQRCPNFKDGSISRATRYRMIAKLKNETAGHRLNLASNPKKLSGKVLYFQ